MTKMEGDIVISRKMMYGIAPMIAIVGVLISRHDVGALVLLILGIGLGAYVGRVSGK